MRQSIFIKANKLKDKVIYEGSGVNLHFYSVGEYKVTINTKDNKTKIWGCTCKMCSIHHGVCPEVLCSYKLAVLKALPLK